MKTPDYFPDVCNRRGLVVELEADAEYSPIQHAKQ